MTSTERDGRTGKHSITVERGVGDRAHRSTRMRDASGHEIVNDMLTGMPQVCVCVWGGG